MRQSQITARAKTWYAVLFGRRRLAISSPFSTIMLTFAQDVDETPDYTDSDTNPNTTASSVAGDLPPDGRKRRSEANQLRRSIFGKKHDRLGESKVQSTPSIQARQSTKSF